MLLSILNRVVAYLIAIVIGLATLFLIKKYIAVAAGIPFYILIFVVVVEIVLLAKIFLTLFKTTEKLLFTALLTFILSAISGHYLFPNRQSFFDFVETQQHSLLGK